MNYPRLNYIIAFLLAFLAIPNLQAQSNSKINSQKEARIDSIFAQWNKPDTPGATLALVHNGEVVLSKGYGNANLEYSIPNTPSTVFHIASISKQFTVFAVLLLEKDGLINLDDDIRKYVPEVPDFGHTITLRHLANHTSGMRDQWNLLTMAGWRMDDVITKEHVMKLVSKQKELNFEPGEEYVYCNTGFTLLAEVVERVSGKTFAQFTAERIFKPLGMKSTLFYDDHERIVKNRAYSYKPHPEGFKKSVLSYANVGATSLFTTVEDLSLWVLNFKNPKVGDKALIEKMNTEATLNNGEKFGGALGQMVNPHNGLFQIHHGGADAGFRTYLGRFPEEDFAVIVFSNDASFVSQRTALQVTDIYLEETIAQKQAENPSQQENPDMDNQKLERFVGEYELENMGIFTVGQDKNGIYARPAGLGRSHLRALSEMEFKVEGEDATIRFIADGNNEISRLEIQQPNKVLKASRRLDFDPKSVILKDFTGTFYSEELSTEYQLTIVDNQLVAIHARNSDIVLKPIKKDTFEGDKFFFREVVFTRDVNNQVKEYKVSNGRVRNLKFHKVGN
ncbi:beta-lactamase family protein [Litoribacter ruber]|uniref:serine hydrolase domain-containing protein n=1 Tax=Litoribacter ruber TaxID=702568 RepID=UPI001BD9C003|nr:serine hydrolase domain-containing protein [Litoribacter ruber]MBT0809807.1 beta-lactamase family protein [Litoribacter ruber]